MIVSYALFFVALALVLLSLYVGLRASTQEGGLMFDVCMKQAEHIRGLAVVSVIASAAARYIGLCLCLFFIACAPTDLALKKAHALGAKRPIIICVDRECTVSGDNFEGFFSLRCGWFSCSEVPPLTK